MSMSSMLKRFTPLFSPSGPFSHVGCRPDLTHAPRAQKALEEAEQRYQAP